MDGQNAVIRELAAGADLDKANDNGATPMMRAAQLGRFETVRALAAAGANVDHADHYGQTAATHAAMGGHAQAAGVPQANAQQALHARIKPFTHIPRRCRTIV